MSHIVSLNLGDLGVKHLKHHHLNHHRHLTITCYITATCYITIIISSPSSDPFRLLTNLSVDFLCHLVGHYVGLTVNFLVHRQEILRKN